MTLPPRTSAICTRPAAPAVSATRIERDLAGALRDAAIASSPPVGPLPGVVGVVGAVGVLGVVGVVGVPPPPGVVVPPPAGAVTVITLVAVPVFPALSATVRRTS